MPITKAVDKNGKPIKKDGKQRYRVRINYTDSYGKQKQIERTAYGLDEAKQLEAELNQSIKEALPAEKIKVKELFDLYINAKMHEVKESTMKKKREILEHHILPYLQNTKLDKLNVNILQKWKEDIESLDLSIRMRKNIYSEFRAMLNFAVKMDYLSQNPLLKVGNFVAPLEDHKEMQFYTPDEFKKFITAARERAETNEKKRNTIQHWNYYVFFNIAFYMGMRKGEIYALNWHDIQHGEIKITKSLNQKLKGGDRITPPKNKSSIRTIQIPAPLQKVLDEHYKRCKAMPDFANEYFICGGVKAIRDTSLSNSCKQCAELAEVKCIRIHDFRHSHASLLANSGINIQEIARRLGHSDVSITLRIYSHLYPKESERALKILNDIVID